MGGCWKDLPVREFPGFFLISSNLASSNCCRSSHCSISSSKSWKTKEYFWIDCCQQYKRKSKRTGPLRSQAAQQLKSRALSYAASKWHHQSISIEITHNMASTQQTPSLSPTTLTVFIFHPQNTPCFSHAGNVYFFSVRTTAYVAVRWPQHVSDVALIVRAS